MLLVWVSLAKGQWARLVELIKERQAISCDKFETAVKVTKNLQQQKTSKNAMSNSQIAQSNIAEPSKKRQVQEYKGSPE